MRLPLHQDGQTKSAGQELASWSGETGSHFQQAADTLHFDLEDQAAPTSFRRSVSVGIFAPVTKVQ